MQSFIMTFLWYVRFFAYFGLQFNLDDLGTVFILNFTAMGIAEVLASLMAAPIKRTFSRKRSMQVSLIICALSCYASGQFTFSFFAAIGKSL